MNSAAQDILRENSSRNDSAVDIVEQCNTELASRHCSPHSASLVLLCNILPGLFIKILYPFLANWIPYGVRQALVCILQAASLLIVALANSVPVALVGVMVGSVFTRIIRPIVLFNREVSYYRSIQCGMGESTFLGLSSHFTKHTIGMYSSGTGLAGLISSFLYAGLTDSHLGGLSSSQVMLATLVIPLAYCVSYYCILEKPETVRMVSFSDPQAWVGKDEAETQKTKLTWDEKWIIIKSLLKYMVPLFLVYFAEYTINQGLVELVIFDCVHSFGMSLPSQYRWFQVLYQIGVFISRSSIQIVQLNMTWIALMPVLQLLNAVVFLSDSIFAFVPHFIIMAAIVLYEGFIGGAAFVNSFSHLHRKIDPSIREFALSVVTLADTSGTVAAAVSSIYIHNVICGIPYSPR